MRVFSSAKAVKCGPAGVVENQCILVGTFWNKFTISLFKIRRIVQIIYEYK